MNASLYIHVPFCAGACDYCDFYSVAIRPFDPQGDKADPRLDAYIERLLAEAEETLRTFQAECVPSLYIGGGTPSVLGALRMEKLLSGLKDILPKPPLQVSGESCDLSLEEFTVEANPESLDEDFLLVCRSGGVNRISLGVQSFFEPSRRAVHRVGELSAAQIEERLSLVSRYYPGAFSADLIAGLPLQSKAVMLEDIRRLLAFEPGHISLYSLTPEEGTPLEQKYREGQKNHIQSKAQQEIHLPGSDEIDSIWLAGRDSLVDSGYEQYEVSNFARQGKRSLHNIRYWRMENWLGLGPGASVTIIDDSAGTGSRYTTAPDLEKWLSRETVCREEFLDRSVLMKESLLMGFRYTDGPDPRLFKRRFGIELAQAIPKTLERWRKKGCLAEDKIALNSGGMLFLNSFLVEAFAELG
jgi:oxygen-independent coproporphyrinogen-3 oxidase